MTEKTIKDLFVSLDRKQRRRFLLELQIKLETSKSRIYSKLRCGEFKEIEREAALKIYKQIVGTENTKTTDNHENNYILEHLQQ